MKFIYFLFFSALSAQNIEIKDARVQYFGSHFLHKWTGVSSQLNGYIFFDKNGKDHKARLEVPLASFDSRNSNRDSNMLTYTEAYSFPSAVFESNSIESSGDSVLINGQINFHGISKPIITSARIDTADGFKVFGSFYIKLSDYNIQRPGLMFVKIDDSIKIDFLIQSPIKP